MLQLETRLPVAARRLISILAMGILQKKEGRTMKAKIFAFSVLCTLISTNISFACETYPTQNYIGSQRYEDNRLSSNVKIFWEQDDGQRQGPFYFHETDLNKSIFFKSSIESFKGTDIVFTAKTMSFEQFNFIINTIFEIDQPYLGSISDLASLASSYDIEFLIEKIKTILEQATAQKVTTPTSADIIQTIDFFDTTQFDPFKSFENPISEHMTKLLFMISDSEFNLAMNEIKKNKQSEKIQRLLDQRKQGSAHLLKMSNKVKNELLDANVKSQAQRYTETLMNYLKGQIYSSGANLKNTTFDISQLVSNQLSLNTRYLRFYKNLTKFKCKHSTNKQDTTAKALQLAFKDVFGQLSKDYAIKYFFHSREVTPFFEIEIQSFALSIK